MMNKKKSLAGVAAVGILATGIGVGVAAPANAASVKNFSGTCSAGGGKMQRGTAKVTASLMPVGKGQRYWKVDFVRSSFSGKGNGLRIVKESTPRGKMIGRGSPLTYKVGWLAPNKAYTIKQYPFKTITIPAGKVWRPMWCDIVINTP